MRKTFVLLLIPIAFCVQNATAQQAPAEDYSEPWHSNLSIGVRTGIRFLNPISRVEETVYDSTTDPPQSTQYDSRSATKRISVGPTLHYQLSDRWAITFDAMFTRSGYDADLSTNTQPEDDENPDFISTSYERTRADYWDFPFLARYYYTGFQEDPARLYLTAGAAVRTVTGIETFSELFEDERHDFSETSTAPVEPARRTVPGVVVGGGFRLRDEVGLKIDVEARYMRWTQRIFDSNVARSSPNEGAIFISFSF